MYKRPDRSFCHCAISPRIAECRTLSLRYGPPNGGHLFPASNVLSDAPFQRKPVRTSIKVIAKAARAAPGFRHAEQPFEVPARLFEQLPGTTERPEKIT